MYAMAFDEERLLASADKRHWVRVTKACNNRCSFCLDMNNLDGTHVPDEEVKKNILDGLEKGCTRLILSGGEASINPKFPEYVEYAKEAGYERIQTISNGRMYCKESYMRELVARGLGEITFSVHGHTEELHDDLVGARGAWKQITKGITNAVALREELGSPIVSIDVVITKKNFKHIHTIIEMFSQQGVHEYDLLHLTPFGNADMEKHKDDLFIDIEESYPYLQKAFAYSKRPGFYIWTNRFPVEFLEGYEDLIQDPRKMKDEVIGRRFLFKSFFYKNKEFPCKGWRCPHCHMKGLCDQIHLDRDALQGGLLSHVEIDFAKFTDAAFLELLSLLKKQSLQVLRLKNAADYSSRVKLLSAEFPKINFVVENPLSLLESKEVFDSIGDRLSFSFTDVAHPLTLPLLTQVSATIDITKENIKEAVLLTQKYKNLIFRFPNYVEIDDHLKKGLDPKSLMREHQKLYLYLKQNVSFENVPQCILSDASSSQVFFDSSMILEGDKVDFMAYVPYYVHNHYYNKAIRCNGCSVNNSCEGYHVNAIRSFGLKSLNPVEDTLSLEPHRHDISVPKK